MISFGAWAGGLRSRGLLLVAAPYMSRSFRDSALSEDLLRAIEHKGFESLTAIQDAVLQADTQNADLRITSVTGSGKTLAIGFALRDICKLDGAAASNCRGPRAIVIVPTRELAKQVQTELSWLFRERNWRIVSATGGTSIRDERRAFSQNPVIIVATPGRLHDHLRNDAFATSTVRAVVLDEADRMLDMGFQEDLHAILDAMPESRQTHMASATFCDAVGRLADEYQPNPVLLRGAAKGEVNADIEHIVHLVNPRQQLDAAINLLLAHPDEQAIMFARTRADVAAIVRELENEGFRVACLSGEMNQPARDRALATFRRGDTRVLVATDVAARGLDIQGVTQIIHIEPPTDPESYVHRSGRTGRAGKQGTSHVLVVPAGLSYVKQLMRRAGTKFQVLPIPTAESLLEARDARTIDDLVHCSEAPADARHRALAERLCEEHDVVGIVAHLLSRVETKEIAPRPVRSPRVEEPRPAPSHMNQRQFGKKLKGALPQRPPLPARKKQTGGFSPAQSHNQPLPGSRPPRKARKHAERHANA